MAYGKSPYGKTAYGKVTSLASPDVTVSITGQSIAVVRGNVTVSGDVTVSITGQVITAASGTVVPATSKAITGQVITAASGTVVPATSKDLTGQVITSAQGAATLEISLNVTGQQSQLTQGAVGIPGPVTVSIAGQQVNLRQGVLTAIADSPRTQKPPKEQPPRVSSRDINWGAMVQTAWGSEFNAPDHNVYQFSNGRGFDSTDKTDNGLYNGGANT